MFRFSIRDVLWLTGQQNGTFYFLPAQLAKHRLRDGNSKKRHTPLDRGRRRA